MKVKELPKVRSLDPNRYILVTSASLSPSNVDEIFDLLSPYIGEKHDILGREGLNRLLGLPEFAEVEKRHYKLWLASSNVLENLLRSEVNRSILTDTRDELELIRKELPLYVQNSSFRDALKLLGNNNFVMISGPPGVGKTMLGRALVAYYLEKGRYELVYVQGSIEHAQSLYSEERQQIFFFDDFWGSVFARNPNDRNEDRRLLKFLEKIQDQSDKKLVLTTREYVFQQGASLQNYPELASFLAETKCVINPERNTKSHRAQILLNHLYFSELEDDALSTFVWLKEYEGIIDHKAFTPRLIKTFIRDFVRSKHDSSSFGRRFSEFLDDPYEFYAEIFAKQTDTAKVVLLIVFISNDPILFEHLLKTLKRSIEPARDVGLRVELAAVSDAIATLEQTFIITSKAADFEPGELKINFVNPSVKDFLLRHLREQIHVYGDILIKSACFFNQLDFVFDTRPGTRIDDYEADDPLFGESIVLRGEQIQLLKSKFLQEFESLNYSTLRSESGDRYTYSAPNEDAFVWKLIRMTGLFDLNVHSDVKEFVLNHHSVSMRALMADGEGKPLSREAMMNFPQLTERLLPYSTNNFDGLVAAFYRSITFTSEFRAMGWLGEVFPEQFKEFVRSNRREIKGKVVETILDDADYFAIDEREFAQLVDEDMDDVLKMFGMTPTRAFAERVYEVAEEIPPWKRSTRTQSSDDWDTALIDLEDGYDPEQVDDDFKALLGYLNGRKIIVTRRKKNSSPSCRYSAGRMLKQCFDQFAYRLIQIFFLIAQC